MDRRAAPWVVVGCLIFWLCVLVAGALNDGYDQRRDFLSALAGRGSDYAWIGVIGILGFSVACAAAAVVWWGHSRAVSLALSVAVVGAGVGAFARLDCPAGAAGCHVRDAQPNTLEDTIHTAGIAVFEAGLLAAMVVAAVVLAQGTSDVGRRRALVVLCVVAAVGGLLALQAVRGAEPGALQRVWAGLNSGWLVVVGTAPVWTVRPRVGSTVDA